MWIEELSNGKFKAVERYEDYLTGKTKKVSITIEKNTAKTRKIAQAALTEKIKAALSETSIKKEYSLYEISTLYLQDLSKSVKQTTHYEYSCLIGQLLLILGKDSVVNRISANYISMSLKSSDKRPSTLNTYLLHFKRMIRWAYRNDFLEDIRYLDKLKPLKEPPKSPILEESTVEKAIYLEAPEVRTLISSFDSVLWRDLTKFLVLTGLRFGEAAALTATDVDLKNRLISVNKNYSMKLHAITAPKSSCSRRQIYIQDELFDLCKYLKREALIRKLGTGCDLLFYNVRSGSYVNHTSYYNALARCSVNCLQKKVTPHVLRHTHGSLLLEQGMSIDAISRRLGHEDTVTTTKIYLHVTERLKEKEYENIRQIQII